jgi:hypothetical protein
MGIIEFLSYIIFNKDGNRLLVWNAFKTGFYERRNKRDRSSK